MSNKTLAEPSSFRDHSGYIFYKDNAVYRKVNRSYKAEYDYLLSSNLYGSLVKEGLLIPHEEVSPLNFPEVGEGYKIIKPRPIEFISYPYEWCFDQLKDAALLTLRIQKIAISHGMTLKDASAYNVQFAGTHPVFIDTLSFAFYHEGSPWVAYRQFCEHFLAVLALMKYKDSSLSALLKSHIDGIPLRLASKLLPTKTLLNVPILSHIHLQSKTIKRYEGQGKKTGHQPKVSKTSLWALIDHLETSVRGLSAGKIKSEWGNYYDITNYSDRGILHKESIIKEYIKSISITFALDIGANEGRFSRIISDKGIYTVSADLDHEAVQRNFLSAKSRAIPNLLPLVIDVTNPSPSIGWRNNERKQWDSRRRPDLIMALALIHHLCFTHNIGFDSVASYFSSLCKWLIIEFVPLDDSQVALLPKPNTEIKNTEIKNTYTKNIFEIAFSNYFMLEEQVEVIDSKRVIYLFSTK